MMYLKDIAKVELDSEFYNIYSDVDKHPATYSPTVRGVEKTLRKFRVQTSSKKTRVTPCMTRMKKSQRSTAPRSIGTKFTVERVLRYRVKNPQRTMSMATQENSGKTRDTLPRIR
jgi:hypothetical protein